MECLGVTVGHGKVRGNGEIDEPLIIIDFFKVSHSILESFKNRNRIRLKFSCETFRSFMLTLRCFGVVSV